jgi:lysozyme family protein
MWLKFWFITERCQRHDDQSNMQAISDYVRTAPVGAILAVLIAQCAGSFVGGLVTGLIAQAKRTTALIYGALALLMAGITMLLIWHPWWFNALSFCLPIPLSLLGSRMATSLVGQRN